jgi:hypothetical protein
MLAVFKLLFYSILIHVYSLSYIFYELRDECTFLKMVFFLRKSARIFPGPHLLFIYKLRYVFYFLYVSYHLPIYHSARLVNGRAWLVGQIIS